MNEHKRRAIISLGTAVCMYMALCFKGWMKVSISWNETPTSFESVGLFTNVCMYE